MARRESAAMHPENSGPGEAPAEDRPKADQDRQTADQEAERISPGARADQDRHPAERPAAQGSRSQREPFSQLRALTDRQKERPERRSFGGEYSTDTRQPLARFSR